MPMYQYQCEDDPEHVLTLRRLVSERNDPVECQCGADSTRVWNVPRFNMPKLRFERQVDQNRKKAAVQDKLDGVKYDWDTGKLKDR